MIRTAYPSKKRKQEALATKHLKLASKIAWSYHKTTGIPFEDLQAEAYHSVCRSVARWDAERAALSTLVYHGVHSRLNKMVAKQRPKDKFGNQPVMVLDIDVEGDCCPTKRLEFVESLKSLGDEATQIARIIFEGPAEVLGIAQSAGKRAIKKAIRQNMLDRGYTVAGIRDGIQEIENLIK